jgi:hypothetical protein
MISALGRHPEKAPEGQKVATPALPARIYEYITSRTSRRLPHRAMRALHRTGNDGEDLGGRDAGTMPGSKARRRPARARASAGRHRVSGFVGSDCVHKFHDGPTYGYSYTWQLFERLVKQRPISIMYETPGRELIQDNFSKEILGVCAQRGDKLIYVKARKGVVLTRGLENNQEMIRNRPASLLLHLRLAVQRGRRHHDGDVGRRDLWHMNNYAGPSMALKVPEIRTTFSMQALHYSKEIPGGMIVVGPDGRRFATRNTRPATARSR